MAKSPRIVDAPSYELRAGPRHARSGNLDSELPLPAERLFSEKEIDPMKQRQADLRLTGNAALSSLLLVGRNADKPRAYA